MCVSLASLKKRTGLAYRTTVPESTQTLTSANLCPLLVHSRHVEDGSHQHCPNCNDGNLRTRGGPANRHDRSLVLTEHVQNTRLIDCLWVDGVVGAGNVNDALDCPRNRCMPAMVVLRWNRQPLYLGREQRNQPAVPTWQLSWTHRRTPGLDLRHQEAYPE